VLISYLWCQLAYIGNDPIRGSPIEVSKQSTLTIPAEHGQAYWMAHMFLYTFVIVHQTIQVQVNHVTLDKFNPFTRVYLMWHSESSSSSRSAILEVVTSMLRCPWLSSLG